MEVVGEGYVAHGDGHGGWVRDGNGAEHVRAVGLGREFDGQVCDGEAAELIQALHGGRLEVVDRRGRESRLVESSLSANVQFDLLAV